MSLLVLLSCSKPVTPKVKLALNQWPGYEFLYLAKEKGFFEKHGLNIEIVETASLAETKRLFQQGKANAMASTMIESVMLASNSRSAVTLALITDYSNGGDRIVANVPITDIKQLKGKRVGVELASLGIFVLYKALQKSKIPLSEIDYRNVEQLDAIAAFKANQIDAYVTYPPYSSLLVREFDLSTIFDSADIPNTILDVVTVASDVIQQDPLWIKRFHTVWQQVLDYEKRNPLEAHNIMASRQGITGAEFKASLQDLILIPAQQQLTTLQSPAVSQNITEVCTILTETKIINQNCTELERKLLIAESYD